MRDIDAVYERFFKLGGPPKGSRRPWHFRRRDTSLRLPAAQLLAQLIRKRQPARVLDLGSGLTSHVIRSIMPELPEMVVVTTDTQQKWLDCTVAELRRDGLNTDLCFEHSAFELSEQSQIPFDFICVDIGNTPFRVALAPKIVRWLAPNGLLFLDDWHMQPYATDMGTVLLRLGFNIIVRKDTLDQFGGFAALASRTT